MVHRVHIRILALAALSVLGAWTGVRAKSDLTSYKLSPGDKVAVTAFSYLDLSGEHLVDVWAQLNRTN